MDAYTTADLPIVSEIMEGLVAFNPDEARKPPTANLALWHQAVDATTYLFDIRDDVYFHPFPKHPQDKLTAADVKFSLELAKTLPNHLRDRMSNIDTIEVLGKTVKITLKRPMKDFISVLATSAGYITSQRYYESLGKTPTERAAAFAVAPIGTGPFLLTAPIRPHASEITLRRFTGYRDATWLKSKRRLTAVTFRFYDDPQDILKDLAAGKVMMTVLPLTEFGRGGDFRKRGTLFPLTPPFLSILAINTHKALLRDDRLRQALNAAVDLTEIVKICNTDIKQLPAGYRKYMEIPLAFLDPQKRVPVTDLTSIPEVAQKLETIRKTGGLTILAPERRDWMMDRILEQVRADFKKRLDIQVTIKTTRSVSARSIAAEQPDLIYREWTPDTPWEYDDLSIVEPLFMSRSLNNYGGFSDKEVDDDFDQLHRINDPGTSDKIYKQIQTRLRDRAPLIWLPIARSLTIFLGKDYRAEYGDPETKSTSSLLFYTPLLKGIKRSR